MQWDTSTNSGFTNASKPWLPVNQNYLSGVNVVDQTGTDSHLSVYQAVSELRKSQQFGVTALFSSENVFAFIREGSEAYFAFVMNVMGDQVHVNLEQLLLELGIASNQSGAVKIRSSGTIL